MRFRQQPPGFEALTGYNLGYPIFSFYDTHLFYETSINHRILAKNPAYPASALFNFQQITMPYLAALHPAQLAGDATWTRKLRRSISTPRPTWWGSPSTPPAPATPTRSRTGSGRAASRWCWAARTSPCSRRKPLQHADAIFVGEAEGLWAAVPGGL